MKTLLVFFYLLVSLNLVSRGLSASQCTVQDIMVKQEKTGILVGGKPEFQVNLFNACPCVQGEVKLGCKGFKTVEKIESDVLVVTGDTCALPEGSFIPPFTGYGFNYAWDSQFQFSMISSAVNCN